MKIYTVFNTSGLNLGNGGFKMMVNFSQGASELGHDIYMVDPKDELSWGKLDWLARDPEAEFDFQIGRFADAPAADRIVTPNVGPLLKNGELIADFETDQIRIWDHDEILTESNEMVTQWALENLSKIAVSNRNLEPLYHELGFENLIYLDNWLRKELFHPGDGSQQISEAVGYQSDSTRSDKYHPYLAPIIQRLPWYPESLKRYRDEQTDLTRYEPYQRLQKEFPNREVVLCETRHSEDMAEKMRQSDIYLFFGAEKKRLKKINGEGFGLPLFEAMACGCCCVAKRHDGNKFLDGIIPLVETLDEAIETIRKMTDEEKEQYRRQGLEQIAKRHRFDEEKADRMEEFLA